MYQSELENFQHQLSWHNKYLEAAGVEELIFVYEDGLDDVGVFSLKTKEIEWFSDFESAEQYCVSSFPDANWETTGWKKD